MTDAPSSDSQLLTALFNAAVDAMIVSDSDGTILRANVAAAELFGHDLAAIEGQSVNMLMPAALASRHDGFMRHHLETGETRIIGNGRNVEGKRADGSVFPLHLSIGRADVGQQQLFIAVLHDLTRRAATEEALARSQRLDAIGQMTSGISHDFNNLLTIVIGNLELLRSKLEDTPDVSLLEDALEAAELGADLTTRLSAYSRKGIVPAEPSDLNKGVTQAVGMLKRALGPGFDVVTHLAEALPPVMIDPKQLQSAILNLALNARDAMPAGGRIIIKTEVVVVDDSYIAQELDVEQGRYVRLSMTDTGMGMGPDTQMRVLEPFFTTKPVGKGTGLGLAMVYGFMRQSGGHIKIYSEIDTGSTMALYFPPFEGERVPDAQAAIGEVPRGQGEVVLVVEDNHHVRLLTVSRLKELGYRTISVSNAENAIAHLRSNPDIRVLFSDIVMPGRNGLNLAAETQRDYPQVKILLTSGYAEDIVSTEDDHTDDIPLLRKPYRQSELALALRGVLQSD